MSDLPDLPVAGFATWRERQLTDAMMFLIRDMERDRPALLMAVIEGEAVWVARMMKAMRAWRVDEDLCRQVFANLVATAGPNPMGQLGQLMAVRPGQGN